MHRFFITPEDKVSEKQFTITSSELVHQWTRVLRFEPGEQVVLLDGLGKEYISTISEFNKKEITGVMNEVRDGKGEPKFHLTLAQSLLKNTDKVEWVLQKGTELGVSAFILLSTDRTERKHGIKRERSERIIQEAAEQSGRAKIPALLDETAFREIFKNNSFVIVPHPEGAQTFSELKKAVGALPADVMVCVGPEGGFSPEEIEYAREQGAHIISLGNRVLRSETAGPVLATLLSEWAGEF